MSALLSPYAAAVPCALTPRLVRRSALPDAACWSSSEFSASTAYITLSPELVCVLADHTGRPSSHQRIGAMGRSVTGAWNAAARGVINEAVSDGQVELWVRDATAAFGADVPRGLQLRDDRMIPTTWLTHPKLFTVLDSHFTQVLRPRFGLTYLTRDYRELFVFDALPSSFARRFASACVMRYSVGFPLVERSDHPAAC
ncbi:hypothetical protein [Corynebacterium sanguinis]|uniref:hypothetical protein n=1 Tax=Corynebacterium sanguinis TaxID=2594913 RepID=UPI00223ACAEA|nr:hypothetical protein [Corynebacterium sanguinis]MCT1694390.1 hypothetical protein [Corynebacterium sanguinis]MCT1713717.1 hypothetical protein [Corynebacterium sanguinis]MCT2251251.1 hypothetical protein [Corynebacterium sanguinis]